MNDQYPSFGERLHQQFTTEQPAPPRGEAPTTYKPLADRIVDNESKAEPSLDKFVSENIEAMRYGMANIVTLGASEEIGAVGDAIFGEYAAGLDARSKKHDELSANHGPAYLVGQIGAGLAQAVMTGGAGSAALAGERLAASRAGPIAKGVGDFAAKGMLPRATLAAGGGAASGGVYAANEGESVPYGLVSGAIGGAGGQALMEGLFKVTGRIKGGKPVNGEATAREEIARSLRTHGYKVDDALVGEFETRLGKLGPNAALADVSEVFQELMASSIKSGKMQGRNRVITTQMRDRAKAFPDQFKTTMTDLFNGPPAPLATLQINGKRIRDYASPKYNEVLQANSSNTTSGRTTRGMVDEAFKSSDGSAIGGARLDLSNSMNDLIDGYSTKVALPGKGTLIYHTPEQLRGMRSEIDGILSKGKFKPSNGVGEASLDSELKARLYNLRSQIDSQFKSSAPGIAELDGMYADVSQITKAHAAAKQYMGTTKTAADTEIFMNTATLPETTAFAEGVKDFLFRKAKSFKDPKAALRYLNNEELRDKVSFALGDDLANGLFAAAERSTIMQTTEDAARIASSAANELRRKSPGPLKRAVQKAVAFTGLTPGMPGASIAAGSGAAERLASTPGMNMSAAGLQQLDSILAKQGPDAAAFLRSLTESGATPQVPFIGGTGMGQLGASTNPDGTKK